MTGNSALNRLRQGLLHDLADTLTLRARVRRIIAEDRELLERLAK
jgi:hypothetical protein